MRISKFGQKITGTSGIGQLMDDLGSALAGDRDFLMLGGGNPAHIQEAQKSFRASMENLLRDGGKFERTISSYGPPGGDHEFIKAVCTLLRSEFRWDIRPKNIALTDGSQTAFFILFNILAGPFEDGTCRKIMFPLAPEYIGYCDVGIADGLFVAHKPRIEHIDDHIFKYKIDFDAIKIVDDIGAICVSRPTNPSGNVLTDAEVERLSDLAGENDIPLIVDNAYGAPFPNIIFEKIRPDWNENTIFCMSLSKLGLPAARTGIVIACEEVVEMVSKVNAVLSLAPGGIGPAIATNIVRSGEIITLSRDVIRPFYQSRARAALELALKELEGIDFHVHKPEGAFFLWLWFPELPITNEELYQRLKDKGVLVVPGHHFFPGLAEQWRHKNECIRVNHSPQTFAAGMKIIAEQVRRAYAAG
ncbi:MAG: valine--pyruvate transaminase [Planctomycetota bacterium]|jgi:valine--pyruvate aminotransferase